MAEDEQRIEFETFDEAVVAAPESVSGPRSAGYWITMLVVLFAAGLIALVWLVTSIDDVADADVLDAVRLEGAAASAIIFEDELLYIDQVPIGAIDSTPGEAVFWRSTDGVEWARVDDDAPLSLPILQNEQWQDFRTIGGGLAVSRDVDVSAPDRNYVSQDGNAWPRVAVEFFRDSFRFAPVALTNDAFVGIRVRSSSVLSEFLVEHTTARPEDVAAAGACFIEGQSIVSCTRETAWPVDAETVDSEAGLAAVLECFVQLQFLGPDLFLASIDRVLFEPIGSELAVFPGAFVPLGLSNGRVANADSEPQFPDSEACTGLVALDDVNPQVTVFDPDGSSTAVALSSTMDSANTEVLGEVPVGNDTLLLVRSGQQFWTLDVDAGDWTRVDAEPSPGSYVLSDSGERLYSFDNGILRVVDIVVANQTVEFDEQLVPVVVPAEVASFFQAFATIKDASNDLVIFDSDEIGSWLVNVSSGETG